MQSVDRGKKKAPYMGPGEEEKRPARIAAGVKYGRPVKGGSTELRLRKDSGGRSWTFTFLSSAKPDTAMSI